MDSCLDCGMSEFDYDERIGEFTCSYCGLVAISELVEETSSAFDSKGEIVRSGDRGHLGSLVGPERGKGFSKLRKTQTRGKGSFERAIDIGITHCNMVLSELTEGTFTPELKETVAIYYKKIITAHLLRGRSYEVRASAVVFYALKEFGYSITLNECASKTGVLVKPLFKAVRNVANFLRKPHLLSSRNAQSEMQKYCNLFDKTNEFWRDCSMVGAYLERHFENTNRPITKTFFAISIYMTALLTKRNLKQCDIAKEMNVTTVTIRTNTKAILNELGMPNRHLLEIITIEQFISGVRYD